MVRSGLLLIVVLLMGGCTAAGSNTVIHSPYEGVPAATLFARWGAPVTAKPLADGGRVYLWYSGRFSAYIPGEDGTADLIGNTDWSRGYPLRDYDTRLECGVRIYTNPDGTIHTILMHETSRGWWEFARCREVFGPPVRTPPGPPGSPVIVWAPNL
jgi:hypothetical protein